jgi:hypothetical protein
MKTMPRYNSQQLTSFLKNAANAGGQMNNAELAHLTVGEMVVPPNIMTPQLFDRLEKIFARRGLDIGRYIVGGNDDSINPRTGLREYYGEGYSESDWQSESEGYEGADFSTGGGEVDSTAEEETEEETEDRQSWEKGGQEDWSTDQLNEFEEKGYATFGKGWRGGDNIGAESPMTRGEYFGDREDGKDGALSNYLEGPQDEAENDLAKNPAKNLNIDQTNDQSKSTTTGHTIGQGIGEDFDFGANEVSDPASNQDSNSSLDGDYDLGFSGNFSSNFTTGVHDGDIDAYSLSGSNYTTPSNQEVADTFAAAKADQEAEEAANIAAASNFSAALNAVADNFAEPDTISPAANTASTPNFSADTLDEAFPGTFPGDTAAASTETSTAASTADYGYDYTASYGPNFDPGYDLGGDPAGDASQNQYTEGSYEDINSTISRAGDIAVAALSETGRSFTPSDAPSGASVPFSQLSGLDQLNEITDYLDVGRLGSEPGPTKSTEAGSGPEDIFTGTANGSIFDESTGAGMPYSHDGEVEGAVYMDPDSDYQSPSDFTNPFDANVSAAEVSLNHAQDLLGQTEERTSDAQDVLTTASATVKAAETKLDQLSMKMAAAMAAKDKDAERSMQAEIDATKAELSAALQQEAAAQETYNRESKSTMESVVEEIFAKNWFQTTKNNKVDASYNTTVDPLKADIAEKEKALGEARAALVKSLSITNRGQPDREAKTKEAQAAFKAAEEKLGRANANLKEGINEWLKSLDKLDYLDVFKGATEKGYQRR